MDDTRLRLIGPSSGNVSGLHQPTLTLGARLAHVPVSLIVRLVPPARIRLLGRDCRTTKMRERDARAAIAANAAQIRLCVKTVIARVAQVPELAEAFAKQRSQKHETRQILSSWRREWDSNPRYGFPYTRFPSVRLKPLGHPSGTVAAGNITLDARVTSRLPARDSLPQAANEAAQLTQRTLPASLTS